MADFDDGKDDGALRTIGEVSEALDIKPHVLRYWEQQFSLLKPLKRSGGRRYYRSADVALVERIDQLVNHEGYTLKGAEAVLRQSGDAGGDRRKEDRRVGDRRADTSENAPSAPVPDLRPKVEEAVVQLRSIRNRLARAIQA